MKVLEDNSFEMCTKCTICTEYCPVSEANSAFPGPKQSGPDGERLRLKDASYFDEALKYCTNCKRCEVVCPSGVLIGDVIQLARKKHGRKKFSFRDYVLSHTDVMGPVSATPLAHAVNAATGFKPIKLLLQSALGIPAERDLPRYATSTFRRWFRKNSRKKQEAHQEQIHLFHGCYINYNNPALGKDCVTVLNTLNVGVRLISGERCCGVPMIANGFYEDARKNARTNALAFQKISDRPDGTILIPSTTCAMTVRDEYPHVLKVDNSGWRSKVDLLTRYVHRLLEESRELSLNPINMTVAYHTSCHMERLGWSGYSISLLRRIPGLTVKLLPQQCCGIAGTYGFKQEYYDTAQKIGSSLFAEIESTGVDLIITECETCRMQIAMSTGKQCEHPITMLARSLSG